MDVAIYGWGLHPIYTLGPDRLVDRRCALPADLRQVARAVLGRIARSDGDYQVYFSNDRFFIYAIGYPALTAVRSSGPSGRADDARRRRVRAGSDRHGGLHARQPRSAPRVGRALLREIRASFYRKLFFAFVLAAVVPVLTLAFVIRAYFADLLRDAVQAEAARTAAVAQRVIQESDALGRRNSEEIAPGSDDVLVSISQVIEQDINIFDGAELLATSERDLFSSGFLPTRTPDDGLPRHRARSPAQLRRRGSDRDRSVHHRRRACPDRRERSHPDDPTGQRANGRSSARSMTWIAAFISPSCASCCSAPRSGSRWPSASPIRCAG